MSSPPLPHLGLDPLPNLSPVPCPHMTRAPLHLCRNQVLIITTGSQAEPRAALSLASREASHQLKIKPNDLVLYRWGEDRSRGGGRGGRIHACHIKSLGQLSN